MDDNEALARSQYAIAIEMQRVLPEIMSREYSKCEKIVRASDEEYFQIIAWFIAGKNILEYVTKLTYEYGSKFGQPGQNHNSIDWVEKVTILFRDRMKRTQGWLKPPYRSFISSLEKETSWLEEKYDAFFVEIFFNTMRVDLGAIGPWG